MVKWFWIVVLALCLAGQAFAQDTQNTTLTDADIQCIIERLHQDHEWLSGTSHPVTSTMDIQLYGYVKLDAAWDSAQVTNGNSAYWVESRATSDSRDDQFNMTVRQTRLGIKLNGPDFGEATTYGQVEVDFYAASAENKNELYMRHAFMKFEWPKDDFHMLAGQYWDLISPLVPQTLNYHVQWLCGNIGYRRPQIRLHKGFGNFSLSGAIARAIGSANTAFNPGPGDTGEDSGFPCTQARAALSFDVGEQKATLGVSGHYALEEYEYTTQSKNEEESSWSGNADLVLPLGKVCSVKAEYYVGKNMNAYLGGIGQGVIIDNANRSVEGINARGGWGALNIKPADCKWCFNLGASADHISDKDANRLIAFTSATDARVRNFSVFGNAIYKINSAASWGLEVSRWRTGYKIANDGDAYRIQTSFIFKF